MEQAQSVATFAVISPGKAGRRGCTACSRPIRRSTLAAAKETMFFDANYHRGSTGTTACSRGLTYARWTIAAWARFGVSRAATPK